MLYNIFNSNLMPDTNRPFGRACSGHPVLVGNSGAPNFLFPDFGPNFTVISNQAHINPSIAQKNRYCLVIRNGADVVRYIWFNEILRVAVANDIRRGNTDIEDINLTCARSARMSPGTHHTLHDLPPESGFPRP